MIKKITIATFSDGDYAGVYDWSGGIPLSVGERIIVKRGSESFSYELVNKATTLEDYGEDQAVKTEYFFNQVTSG